MMFTPYRFGFLIVLGFVLVGCDVLDVPTPTPTQPLSGPTLEASPTVQIFTSEELYPGNAEAGFNPTTSSLPARAALPPLAIGTREPGGALTVEIVVADDVILLGDLYARGDLPTVANADGSETLQRQPGILILASLRSEWGNFPAFLSSQGATVLVVEMRQPPVAADMDALLTSLSESGTVDPGRIGVIGAGTGADMALMGCAVTPICAATVLLSPQGRDTLANVVASYNPRPLFIAAATDDATSFAAAQAVALSASNARFEQFTTGRGPTLLSLYPELPDQIVEWLLTSVGEAS